MQKFNYHTHTYRCRHANGTDEEYVLAAIKAGYKSLGFADHAPYKDFPSETTHMDIEELDDYISSINYLKEKYKDQIDIHLGLETEYFAFNHDERVELRNKVEYLILGQHFSDPDKTINYFKHNTDEEIIEYGQRVCQALDTGLFLYLAHPDVFMNRQDEFTPACAQTAHTIAKKLVELDIPAEINIRGILKGRKEFKSGLRYYYPHKEFWTIMAQYPIRCLIGVDAHDPDELLNLSIIEKAHEELTGLNINFIQEPLL